MGNMKKDAPLAFRISADLKRSLQQIAASEARSVSQICELLLKSGVDGYKSEGPQYLRHSLTRQKSKDKAL